MPGKLLEKITGFLNAFNNPWIVNVFLIIGVLLALSHSIKHCHEVPLPKPPEHGRSSHQPDRLLLSQRNIGDSEYYSVIVENDIFRAERSPWLTPTPLPENLPPTPTPTPEKVNLRNYKLDGVIIFGSKFKRAFISHDKKTSSVSVPCEVGEDVGGFTVAEILPDMVVLKRGNEYDILRYDRFGLFPEGYTKQQMNLLEKYVEVDDAREIIFKQANSGVEVPHVKEYASGKEFLVPLEKKDEFSHEPPPEAEKIGNKYYVDVSGKKMEWKPPPMPLNKKETVSGAESQASSSESGGKETVVVSGKTFVVDKKPQKPPEKMPDYCGK